MDQFVVSNLQTAMASDDKETARAMTTMVGTPSFINGMFDYIVYAKCNDYRIIMLYILIMQSYVLYL